MDIRVVIADDQTRLRNSVRGLLESVPGFRVLGEAADGLAAVKAADAVQPEVVIMDIAMPELNGIEATRLITTKHPGIIILGMSQYLSEEVIRRFLQSGAAGYVSKNQLADRLVEALQVVTRGEYYINPELRSPELLKYLRKLQRSNRDCINGKKGVH